MNQCAFRVLLICRWLSADFPDALAKRPVLSTVFCDQRMALWLYVHKYTGLGCKGGKGKNDYIINPRHACPVMVTVVGL